jgi:hypothetical protein
MTDSHQTRQSGRTVRNAAALATLVFVSLRVVPYVRETVVPHFIAVLVRHPTATATGLWLLGLGSVVVASRAANRIW